MKVKRTGMAVDTTHSLPQELMWGPGQRVDGTQRLPMSWLGFSYAPGHLPCKANPGALETDEKSAEDSEQGIRVHKIQTPSRPSLLSNWVGGGLSAATLLDSSVRTDDPHPPRGLLCPCSDHTTDGRGRHLPCGGRRSLASSLQEEG